MKKTKPNPTRLAPYGKCRKCKKEVLQSWLDSHEGICYSCSQSKNRAITEFSNGD